MTENLQLTVMLPRYLWSLWAKRQHSRKAYIYREEFFCLICCVLSQQPSKKCKSYCAKQQREGIWADEQILAAGGNRHQAGKDLPLPYGVITCRFSANWQQTPAYGIGSPLPAQSFCSHCSPCHILLLIALLTRFFFLISTLFLRYLSLSFSCSWLSGSLVFPLRSSVSRFLFPLLLLSVADTTNHHNNHLSTITTQLRQAEIGNDFFLSSSSCDMTVHCSSEREKRKKKWRQIDWLRLEQTVLPVPLSSYKRVFFSLLIPCHGEICTRAQTHIRHFPGSKPHDAKLGTWLAGVAKRKGNAYRHLGDSITALCTPLQITLYTNICRALSWHCVS